MITPNTPPPRSLGSSEPPRASSEIHSAPTGARELGSQLTGNVPRGHAETIGSESLPAVGVGSIDWEAMAHALAPVARTAGCRCDYERTKAGVPIWFPMEGGGIGRKLIRQCSKCIAVDAYDEAVAAIS